MKKAFKPLHEQIERMEFIDIVATYRNLIASERYKGADWAEATVRRLSSDVELAYEDAVPILYLMDALHGASRMNRIRHVVVDEAQDYTPLQWAYLKRMFPNAGFTALGDVRQAIHGVGGGIAEGELEALFPTEETAFVRLQRSYRSTRPIVEFTSAILPEGGRIEPFEREGEPPAIERVSREQTNDALAEKASARIRAWMEEGFASIAVIAKTASESEEAFRLLSARLEAHLLSKHSKSFRGGVVVLPSYLAKGLEFDAVLIWDAGEQRYGKERERKLFYTVCTRALHRLHLFYRGEPSPFLQEARAGAAVTNLS